MCRWAVGCCRWSAWRGPPAAGTRVEACPPTSSRPSLGGGRCPRTYTGKMEG